MMTWQDMWTLDLDTVTWQHHEIQGDALPATANTNAVVIGNEIVYFGGNYQTDRAVGVVFNLTVIVNVATLTGTIWPTAPGRSPSARTLHSSSIYRDTRMYVVELFC